jgi:molybdate transport system regulatory protein
VMGPVSAEVTLALAEGRSVTAGITRESLDRLGLAKGKPASALFKASSVILVALD